MEPKKKKRRLKVGIYWIIMGVCATVFIVSTGKLISIWLQYKQAADNYKKLQDTLIIDPSITNDQTFGKGPILPDYKSLAEQNPDLVGWIYLPNENAYPVMYAPDRPQYYLRKNFNKEYSDGGSIFIADDNKLNDNHIVLYGHHMLDGSMFNIISKYIENEDYINEHSEIRFDSLDTVRIYKIFASVQTSIQGESDGFNIYTNIGNLNEEEYNKYVTGAKTHSLINVEDTPEYGTPLITMSTCSYHLSDKTGREAIICYLEKEYDKTGNPIEIPKTTGTQDQQDRQSQID